MPMRPDPVVNSEPMPSAARLLLLIIDEYRLRNSILRPKGIDPNFEEFLEVTAAVCTMAINADQQYNIEQQARVQREVDSLKRDE